MQIFNIKKGDVADSLYLQFSNKPITHSVELSPELIIDVAEDNIVVGFDIQYVTEVSKERMFPGMEDEASQPPMRLQLVGA